MSITSRRAEIAAQISLALNSHEIGDVSSYKDVSPAPFTGWLEIRQTDTQECTFGEVRLTFGCLVVVAADRTDFERVQDTLTVPLIRAIEAAGGRGVVVQPAEYPVAKTILYCLDAQFVTEASNESETP